MNGGVWPHVHGTPAYADFPNGRSFMYVWPEKDHLKAYERDRSSASLRFSPNPSTSTATAPGKYPGWMPGGFVSLALDPNPSGTGVVFASVPADSCARDDTGNCLNDTKGDMFPGRLYAFDPIPQGGKLNQLWDNSSDTYGFAKFVPPTIANGRVYLATSTNEVLVYGMKNNSLPVGSGDVSPTGVPPHNCGTGNSLPCLK